MSDQNKDLQELIRGYLFLRKNIDPENHVPIEDISENLGISEEIVEPIIKIFIDNLFDKKNPEPRTPKEISEELNIVLEDILRIVDGEKHEDYQWKITSYPTMGVIPTKIAIPS